MELNFHIHNSFVDRQKNWRKLKKKRSVDNRGNHHNLIDPDVKKHTRTNKNNDVRKKQEEGAQEGTPQAPGAIRELEGMLSGDIPDVRPSTAPATLLITSTSTTMSTSKKSGSNKKKTRKVRKKTRKVRKMKKKVRGSKKNVRSVTTLERLSGMDDTMLERASLNPRVPLRGFTEKGRNDKDDEEEYDEEREEVVKTQSMTRARLSSPPRLDPEETARPRTAPRPHWRSPPPTPAPPLSKSVRDLIALSGGGMDTKAVAKSIQFMPGSGKKKRAKVRPHSYAIIKSSASRCRV